MTLPESLARKALPCRWPTALVPPCTCGECERRPAVEAVLREMVEACANDAEDLANPCCVECEEIRKAITARLTEELPND